MHKWLQELPSSGILWNTKGKTYPARIKKIEVELREHTDLHSCGFSRSKIAPGTSSLSFTFSSFFFLLIPPSFLLFWTVLTPLKHSTSLSVMFFYIHVPPDNPINRARLVWVPGYHSFPKWAIGVPTAPKYITKPIRYVTLHFWGRRGAVSRRHNRSREWTEALSRVVFLAAQKLSGIAWTKP